MLWCQKHSTDILEVANKEHLNQLYLSSFLCDVGDAVRKCSKECSASG